MNHIDPEDFEWSDELNHENFNYEKNIFINSLGESKNDEQCLPSTNNHPLNKEALESIDLRHSAEEKCYTSLGESEIKLSNKSNFQELEGCTRHYCEDALNCLYRSEKNSIDQENFMICETKENHIRFEEEPLCNNKSSASISNNSEAFKVECFNGNTLLNSETISLISNSISGVYEPPESFSSINYSSKENEQVVPNTNYITFDENEIPQASFDFPNQNENMFIDEHTSENNGASSITNDVDSVSNTNEVSSVGDLLGLCAYTPGGQCYRLSKRSHLYSKTKVAINENQLEVAVLLNSCKKLRQIQGGILIPDTIDYKKEEDFYNWLRQEKDKTKYLFENLNIKLNIQHLTAERDLIKLDRYLKQYAMSDFFDPLKILEFIEKTDIDLNNLVFTHQVYETVSKIMKNSKGHLRVKFRRLFTKLKSLLSPPKGIKAEKYLNDLVIKNNATRLKADAPIEWIVHLLTFL